MKLAGAVTSSGSPASTPQTPKSRPLHMELLRAEFRQITAIDQINQTFTLRLWLHFIIKDVGTNDRLCDGLDNDDGKPPFKSARWYASMLQWQNASSEPQVLTKIINKIGNDINLMCIPPHEIWQTSK